MMSLDSTITSSHPKDWKNLAALRVRLLRAGRLLVSAKNHRQNSTNLQITMQERPASTQAFYPNQARPRHLPQIKMSHHTKPRLLPLHCILQIRSPKTLHQSIQRTQIIKKSQITRGPTPTQPSKMRHCRNPRRASTASRPSSSCETLLLARKLVSSYL